MIILLAAVYNCSPKARKKGVFTYYSLILAAYTIGCVFFRLNFRLFSVSLFFNLLMDNLTEKGYFAAFIVLFSIKAVIFLTVYFLGYFCFGRLILRVFTFCFGVFYGQLAGHFYSGYGYGGMLIFLFSFLIFGIIVSLFLYYRAVCSIKISGSLFDFTFHKLSNTSDFNNKDNLIKTIITLLIMLIISSAQTLVLKVITFIAT